MWTAPLPIGSHTFLPSQPWLRRDPPVTALSGSAGENRELEGPGVVAEDRIAGRGLQLVGAHAQSARGQQRAHRELEGVLQPPAGSALIAVRTVSSGTPSNSKLMTVASRYSNKLSLRDTSGWRTEGQRRRRAVLPITARVRFVRQNRMTVVVILGGSSGRVGGSRSAGRMAGGPAELVRSIADARCRCMARLPLR